MSGGSLVSGAHRLPARHRCQLQCMHGDAALDGPLDQRDSPITVLLLALQLTRPVLRLRLHITLSA